MKGRWSMCIRGQGANVPDHATNSRRKRGQRPMGIRPEIYYEPYLQSFAKPWGSAHWNPRNRSMKATRGVNQAYRRPIDRQLTATPSDCPPMTSLLLLRVNPPVGAHRLNPLPETCPGHRYIAAVDVARPGWIV